VDRSAEGIDAARAAAVPVVARSARESREVEGIAVQAEVHDRHQVELRFNYPLGEAEPRRYLVDVFLFLPRSLGIHAGSYPREQFYADFTAYMRMDALPLPLDALADATHPASPLRPFVDTLHRLQHDPRPPPTAPARVHVKLYANLFAVGVRRECRRLEKGVTRRLRDLRTTLRGPAAQLDVRGASLPPDPAADAAWLSDLEASLARIREALWAFRRVRAGYWPFERLSHASLAGAMRVADEYMSLALEERLAGLWHHLGAAGQRFDGTAFVARARLRVAALAREEAQYRARYGYLTLRARDLDTPGAGALALRHPGSAGELFTYRASQLKKSVQQALYLAVRGARADTFVRNAVGAVAAALAAIWAFAAQVPTQLAGLPVRTQLLVFAAAVVAYVLKDRIKALTSEALLRRLRLFDHTSVVYGETLPELGIAHFHARMSEVVRFTPFASVPDAVRKMRMQRRTVQHSEPAGEEVLHYHKRLDVGGAARGAPEGYRLRDILRINVRHFLARLDEPEDEAHWYDLPTATFQQRALPRVYHVNVVVRVRQVSAEGEAVRDRDTHLRVVINKEGIVRVETVDSRGPRPR
jgi:hypothetical protein